MRKSRYSDFLKFLTRTFLILFGFVVFIVATELVLRALPVSRGNYAAEWSNDWPAPRLEPNREYVHSLGWDFNAVRHGRTNEQGYVAPFAYLPKTPIIAVFGNSFVESLMNRYDETLQGRLPRYQNTSLPVYNFGISGAGLGDYLETAKLVSTNFKPEWLIFIISTHDISTGFEVRPERYYITTQPNGNLNVVPGPVAGRGKVRKLLRESALLAYVRNNLNYKFDRLFGIQQTAVVQPEAVLAKEKALMEYFVDQVAKNGGVPFNHIILAFDSNREAMYRVLDGKIKGNLSSDEAHKEAVRRYFMTSAKNKGLQIIDLENAFRESYQSTWTKFDFLPLDGHWNSIGHDLVARQIGEKIRADHQIEVLN